MASKDVIAARRTIVANLRRKGYSQRKIREALPHLGSSNPASEDGLWALGTINKDVKALRAEWAKERLDDTEGAIGEQLEKLAQLETTIWEGMAPKKKGGEVIPPEVRTGEGVMLLLRVYQQQAALQGLDAMTRHKIEKGDKVALELSPEAVKVIEEMGISLATVGMQFEALLKNMRLAVV